MTLQQEAYNKIDQLSDDNVRFVIQLIDKIQQGEKNEGVKSSRQSNKDAIMRYAGKIDVDEDAVNELREGEDLYGPYNSVSELMKALNDENHS